MARVQQRPRRREGHLTALAFVAFAIAAWGCGGASGPTRLLTFEEFEAQAYREVGAGLFVVDGDTPVRSREELRDVYRRYVEDRSSLGTRRRALIVHQVDGVDARWDDVQALNLSYCVSTTFEANYDATVQAMEEATAKGWEIPANVHFIHEAAQDDVCDATNEKVVFDVNPITGVGYLARAFFPNFERAFRNILINTTAFGDISPWTLAGVLRHETGHALGFRHEHTRPEAGVCFEDNNWRALTVYDSDSVMHYPQCNGTNRGDLVITELDAEGAASLYPF